MKNTLALYGFFAVLVVRWNASLGNAEPRKLPRLGRTFAQRPIAVKDSMPASSLCANSSSYFVRPGRRRLAAK